MIRTPGKWRARRVTENIVAIESELPCINGLAAWFTVATLYEPDEAEVGMSGGATASAMANAEFIVSAVNSAPDSSPNCEGK
jgi:hypothetical protein